MKTKREKFLVFVGLPLVLLAGLGYLLKGRYDRYQALREEIRELRDKIEEARAAAPRLEQMQAEEEELQAALDSALARLPSQTDVTRLLEIIEEIAHQAGIPPDKITTKELQRPAPSSFYTRHGVALRGIKGLRPATLAELLVRIQNYEKIIEVESIQLTHVEEDRYDVDLGLVTYTAEEAGEGASP